MGLHISAPGLATIAPAARLGRVSLLDANESMIYNLLNLAFWLSAKDALADGSTWVDRKSNAVLTGAAGTTPTLATVDGAKAVRFAGGQFMDGDPSIGLTNNFTYIYKIKLPTPLATGVITSGGRTADFDGPTSYVFADGSFHAQVRSGQQAGSSPVFTAGQTVILDWSWDGTTLRLGVNGTLATEYVPATGGPAPTPSAHFRVGADAKDAGNTLKADIFDILLFDACLREGDPDRAQQLALAVARL